MKNKKRNERLENCKLQKNANCKNCKNSQLEKSVKLTYSYKNCN